MNIAYLIIGLSCIWCFSEIVLAIVKQSRVKSNRDIDKSSFRILWFVIVVSVTTGVLLGLRKSGFIGGFGPWISIAGIVFIIIGMVIRWIAVFTLKKYFTVDIAVQKGQQICTDGIYKYIRHPSYLGSILSFIGLGLSFSNWISVMVIIFPIGIAFYYRINVEEKALSDAFKSEYDSYRARSKMLIPFIF
jgi:protein-S-isoprenylcysteine O-methyltransferase Ste14